MKASFTHSAVTVILIFAALATVAPGRAQQVDDHAGLLRSPRAYQHAAQAEAANELVTQLGSAGKDLNTLFQLSRLLSDPCDQVRWLAAQIESLELAIDAQRRSSAEELLTRVTELEQTLQSTLRSCPEQVAALKQLLTRIAEPPTPWELTDPAQLAERWRELGGLRNAELTRELTPERRLTLFARGIPPNELGLDGQALWEQPRRVVGALAASAQLPETWRLLQLQEALGAAERERTAWAELAFPVDDTFEIARGLLDRALGIDAQDRGAAASAPDWAGLAARLEAGDYWAWAGLARVLEAAGQQDPATAFADARTQWSKLARVSSALGGAFWPAVSGGEQGWLARLEHGELAGAGLLPLAPEYRSAQRAARRRYEQQFLQARNNPAEALRLIQLAKAAAIGLTEGSFQPITQAELEGQLQTTSRGEVRLKVFALLEMIEIQNVSGQSSQYYGFRLNARQWRWDSGGFDAAVIIGPADTPTALVQAALDPAGELGGMRLLIAPDGPLGDDWLAFEKDYLLERSSGSTAWLCYTPSIATLVSKGWTLDRSLRYWYRMVLGASDDGTLTCYSGRQEEPRSLPRRPHLAPNLPLYAVSIGPMPIEVGRLRAGTFLERFWNAKQAESAAGRTLPVMLVFIGEQP